MQPSRASKVQVAAIPSQHRIASRSLSHRPAGSIDSQAPRRQYRADLPCSWPALSSSANQRIPQGEPEVACKVLQVFCQAMMSYMCKRHVIARSWQQAWAYPWGLVRPPSVSLSRVVSRRPFSGSQALRLSETTANSPEHAGPGANGSSTVAGCSRHPGR